MPDVHVIQNIADPDTGWLGETLDSAAVGTRVVRAFAGESLPRPEEVAALVVLGGPQGAYEHDRYPYLADEQRLLEKADEAGVPVLGICLGAQLLAAALGGRAFATGDVEVGYPPAALTAAGERDPVLRELDGPVLAWHRDTFELPPGAELLAVSDRYPFAFRRGRAIGLQFHPEASPQMLSRWLRRTPTERLERDGIDPDQWLRDAESVATSARSVSSRLFTAWLQDAAVRVPAERQPQRP